jgi:RNA polymerase sigma factor (sigma-70 family)
VTPETPSPTAPQLTLLDSVIAAVARGHRLNREDRQDFSQSVHLHLAERDYDIFVRFAGRSSLRTFLHVSVSRLLLDWRNAQRGKWRPSAAARRRGTWAVELERLVYRDGHPPSEAVAHLARRPDAPDAGALARLLGDLPVRHKRVLNTLIGDLPDRRVEDYVEAEERRRRRSEIARAVAGALRALPADQRRLIALRYGRGLKIGDIARAHRVPPTVLYRRVERAMRTLRLATLAAQRGEAADALGRAS